MFDLAARLQHEPSVTFRPVPPTEEAAPDGAVLLQPETRVYYTLDATGAQFWQLVDGHRTLEEIAATIARERGDHVEAVEAELSALARALLRDRFLRLVHEEPAP